MRRLNDAINALLFSRDEPNPGLNVHISVQLGLCELPFLATRTV